MKNEFQPWLPFTGTVYHFRSTLRNFENQSSFSASAGISPARIVFGYVVQEPLGLRSFEKLGL